LAGSLVSRGITVLSLPSDRVHQISPKSVKKCGKYGQIFIYSLKYKRHCAVFHYTPSSYTELDVSKLSRRFIRRHWPRKGVTWLLVQCLLFRKERSVSSNVRQLSCLIDKRALIV